MSAVLIRKRKLKKAIRKAQLEDNGWMLSILNKINKNKITCAELELCKAYLKK